MSWKSPRQEKRERKEREGWEREEARLREEGRRERLTMWERIEECTDDEKLRDVLHRIASGEREE